MSGLDVVERLLHRARYWFFFMAFYLLCVWANLTITESALLVVSAFVVIIAYKLHDLTEKTREQEITLSLPGLTLEREPQEGGSHDAAAAESDERDDPEEGRTPMARPATMARTGG